MKYLIAILFTLGLSTTVQAKEDLNLCDSVAALSYAIADDYYSNGSLAYYSYDKAETVLEVAIIDIMVETQPSPIQLATTFRNICINDPQLILEGLYLPL